MSRKMTRREALAGAGAGLLIVKPETAFGTPANSAVVFGTIGTGGRGRYVTKLMTDVPGSKLGMICDVMPDRLDLAKTEIPGGDKVPSTKDYRELLANKDIDAVLIATPVYLHPEHFEAATRAKKHIYCEKPAGADLAGVKRLMAAAEIADKSKTIAFGFQQRFSPEYLAAEKIVRNPEIFGEMTLMMSFWVWGGSAFRGAATDAPPSVPADEATKIRKWGAYRETSGDFIVEQDCHGVDVLNWFAQAHPLKAIGDQGRKARKYGNIMDHVNVTYEYPNGLKGWLLGTQLPPDPYWDVKEQFFGTKGVVETERSYYIWTPAGQRSKGTVMKSKREITIDAVEAFFQSIQQGKPFSMARDAAHSTLTSLLGRMACDKRREVTWEEMMKSA